MLYIQLLYLRARNGMGVLVNNELHTDPHETTCQKQIIRVYETLRGERPPELVQRMRDFLVKGKVRKNLGMPFHRRNGWKTMAELTQKLGWETSLEWTKEEREEALDKFGNKARVEATNQAAQKGSAVSRYFKEWPNKEDEDGIAKNLCRPCPVHLWNGRRLEEQIKMSC